LAESADKAFRGFSAFRVQPRIKRRTPNSRNPQTKHSAGSARSACNPESNAARRTRGIRRQSIPRVQRVPRATPNQTPHAELAESADKVFRGFSAFRVQPRIKRRTPNSRNPQTKYYAGSARSACNPESNAARRTRGIRRQSIPRVQRVPRATPNQTPHAELAESADKVLRGFSAFRVQPRIKRRTPNSRNPQTKYSAGSARSTCNHESNAARRTRGIRRQSIPRVQRVPRATPNQTPHAELAESADKVFRGFSAFRVQPRIKRRTPNSRNPQTKYYAGSARSACNPESNAARRTRGIRRQSIPRVQRVPRATPNQTPHAELAESADKVLRGFSAFRVQPRIKRRTPNSRNPQTKYSAGSARSTCNHESNAARRTRGIRRQSIPRVQRVPRATPNQTPHAELAESADKVFRGFSAFRVQPRIKRRTPNSRNPQTKYYAGSARSACNPESNAARRTRGIRRQSIQRVQRVPRATTNQTPHAELAESADKAFRGFSAFRVQPRIKRRTPNSRNPQTKYSAGSARSACNPESNAARRTRGIRRQSITRVQRVPRATPNQTPHAELAESADKVFSGFSAFHVQPRIKRRTPNSRNPQTKHSAGSARSACNPESNAARRTRGIRRQSIPRVQRVPRATPNQTPHAELAESAEKV